MSSEANPISPGRFADALKDLPLSALHAKAAELRNSLDHLASSNEQLQPFADEGDADCADAISENVEVMARFRGRIDMLRAEVVDRGMPWVEVDGRDDGEAASERRETRRGMLNGGDHETTSDDTASTTGQPESTLPTTQGGRLTDEELRRRMEEQMNNMQPNDDDNNEGGGMHL